MRKITFGVLSAAALTLAWSSFHGTDRTTAPSIAVLPPAADYAEAFTSVLQRVLTPEGLVRYELLLDNPEWSAVVAGVERFHFDTDAEDHLKLAFWINAYNVHMLNLMAARPRRRKVLGLDFGAVFFKSPVLVAGQQLTLDQIEHEILRRQNPAFERLSPSYLEPRIHVALNCAAVSCPRLWPEAFTPEKLDAQLDHAMTAFVNSPDKFAVTRDRLVASSLLDWYGADFDTADHTAGDFLLSYMRPDRPQFDQLVSLLRGKSAEQIKDGGARFEYDWTVNRAPN